jgi:hypothetical protein
VNASFNFNTTTASQDFGVGIGTGTGDARSVSYTGCGSAANALTLAPSGTGADIPECATDLRGGYDINGTPAGAYGIATRGPYRVSFSQGDRLGNTGTSVFSQPFGVDKTAPLIRFSATSSADTTIGAFAFQTEVIDERSGFIDPFFDNNAILRAPTTAANLLLNTNLFGSQHQFASRGAGVITNTTDRTNCINPNTVTAINNTAATPVALSANPFMTAPPCPYLDLPAGSIAGQLSDGYRSAFAVNIPTDGLYRYNTRVFDRAGNVSDVASRRAARDLTAPPVVTDLNVPINLAAASTPAFQVTASDNVELRASNIALSYGAAVPGGTTANPTRLRYPQVLLDARFNDLVNSPNQRDLTVPLPQPFVISLQVATGNVPPTSTAAGTNADSVRATLFDVANAPGTSPAVSFAATSFSPTQNGFGTVNPAAAPLFTSFSVLPSTAAGFNAGAGVKAQLVSNTNVTNQQFVRVDFYRLTAGEYQYLGSVSTPAVADQGNTRYFTYALPDAQFAATPTAFETQQPAVTSGDNIIAIGVRSNGSGLVTGAATVIGSQLATVTIPVTGLPSGVAGNITVTCTDGVNAPTTQVITGPTSIQVNPGTVCNYTAGNSSPAPGTGLIFTPTPTTGTVTAGAVAGSTATGTAINYSGGQTLNVAISGLPITPTTPVVVVSGSSGTFNSSAPTNAIPQLAPGTYSVGAVGQVTVAAGTGGCPATPTTGCVYVLSTLSNTSVSITPTAANPSTVTATYVQAGTLSGAGALAAGGPAAGTTLTITGGPLGTATRTVLGGTTASGVGGTISLAPGAYTVTSGAVSGFAGPTPTTQQVTITAGAASTVGAITYTPQGNIALSTTCTVAATPQTSPPSTTTGTCPAGVAGLVTVTNSSGTVVGTFASGAGTTGALPAGTYTITPTGDVTVNGVTYYSVGAYTVTVANNTTTTTAANFTQAGSIVVNITGVPQGSANVVLTIQGGATSVLDRNTTINNVRPNTVYSIVVNDVVIGGVTYRATPNNYIGLTVSSGNATVTNVQYVAVP